jgi:uncharacterized protein (DUF305 family)
MSFKHHKLLAALAAGMALAVAGCGSDESHDSHNASGTESSEQAGRGIDRAFAQAMIPHHESAIEMAEVAQERGESRFVKQLADDIVGTQNAEIETLRAQDAELEGAGVEPGDLGMSHEEMGMDDDASMLDNAEPFDAAFIEMMIPHHEGAIAMAKVELEKGADPELKALAQDIIDAQQREIDAMKEHVGADDSMEGMDHSG